MTLCRVCSRTPEDIAVAAAAMRHMVDPALAGVTLRTRYRVIGPRMTDEVCFFCWQWFMRLAPTLKSSAVNAPR